MKPTTPTTTQFTIDLTVNATPDRVWRMWTTKDGLERWWGPDGFQSVVRHLDVRVGGRFEIVMTAVDAGIVEFMKSSGMPTSSVAKGDYTAIEPNRRLVYANAIDFVPGVTPYTSTTRVDIEPLANGQTRLIVANDVMHDEHWTSMASQGWEQQIGRLVKLFA